jgi:hypothetical protein
MHASSSAAGARDEQRVLRKLHVRVAPNPCRERIGSGCTRTPVCNLFGRLARRIGQEENIASDGKFQCPDFVAADRRCVRMEEHAGACDAGVRPGSGGGFQCIFCTARFSDLAGGTPIHTTRRNAVEFPGAALSPQARVRV